MKVRHKSYRLISYLTVIIFMISILVILNFPNFVYYLNKDDYTSVMAEVHDVSYDGLTALIPKISIGYTYHDDYHNGEFYFYNYLLFKSRSFGNTVEVMVNNNSPKDVIYVHDFFDSKFNIGILIIILICGCIILNNIKRRILQGKHNNYVYAARQEAKRRMKYGEKSESDYVNIDSNVDLFEELHNDLKEELQKIEYEEALEKTLKEQVTDIGKEQDCNE